ncbi:MAG: alpha/beta hydrolase [Syntrophotaleaceae bacterium]
MPAPGFRFLLFLNLMLAGSMTLSGCEYGTRFVFQSSRDVLQTPDARGINYEDIWFESDDGVRLHGWYVPAASPGPLIVYFHGNAANITHRVENLQYLNHLGLPVFIFDYRGYGASEGRPLKEEDLYRDGRAALRFLETRGWNPERTIYFGRSMGAAVALQMALENPPAGLVLECSFTSLRDMARIKTPVVYALVGWWAIGERFDNLGKISRLQKPLLMIHGDRDQVVPWIMGKQLFESAPEPKTFLSVSGAGHSDSYLVGGASYQDAWESFLKQVGQLPIKESKTTAMENLNGNI